LECGGGLRLGSGGATGRVGVVGVWRAGLIARRRLEWDDLSVETTSGLRAPYERLAPSA